MSNRTVGVKGNLFTRLGPFDFSIGKKIETRIGRLSSFSPLVKLQGDESAYVNEIAAASYAENGDFERALQFQKIAFSQVNEKNGTVDFYDEAKTRGLEERMSLFSGRVAISNILAR